MGMNVRNFRISVRKTLKQVDSGQLTAKKGIKKYFVFQSKYIF